MADKKPQPGLARNIIVASLIIIGVTGVWLTFMFAILKIFAAGFVVVAWLIFGAVAYLVLRNKKT